MNENMNNEKETLHRNCAPHDAAHCDINGHHNLDPGLDDCGHTVNAGPGKGKPAYEGHNGTVEAGAGAPDSANSDQDPEHGPGAQR